MKQTITTVLEAEEIQVQSLKVKDDLNPKIWDKDKYYTMRSDVRTKLMESANYFLEYCDMGEFGISAQVTDIILTGSLANYNWSSYSDLDVHIVMDMSEIEEPTKALLQSYFSLRKKQFAQQHDIRVKSYEVEMYIQDGMDELVSLGVYSISNDNWITFPKKHEKAIDWEMVKRKGARYMEVIDELIDAIEFGHIKSPRIALERIRSIWKKIKSERRAGLAESGEFAVENLIFKGLRRNGYIQKIMDLRSRLVSQELSLAQ